MLLLTENHASRTLMPFFKGPIGAAEEPGGLIGRDRHDMAVGREREAKVIGHIDGRECSSSTRRTHDAQVPRP